VSVAARFATLHCVLGGARHAGIGVSRRDAALDYFKVADDDRQQVVEVMRDTGGQPTDRLHLVRLAQPLLDRTAGGDVAKARKEGRLAVPRGLDDPHFGVDPAAVRTQDDDFGRFAGDGHNADGRADQGIERPTEHLLYGRIGEEDNAVPIRDHDPVGVLLYQKPEFSVADAVKQMTAIVPSVHGALVKTEPRPRRPKHLVSALRRTHWARR
jgi:hypothetical protein